jgi:hypothetical protein
MCVCLFVFVCVFVCVHVWQTLHVHVYLNVSYVWVYVRMYVRTYIYTLVYKLAMLFHYVLVPYSIKVGTAVPQNTPPPPPPWRQTQCVPPKLRIRSRIVQLAAHFDKIPYCFTSTIGRQSSPDGHRYDGIPTVRILAVLALALWRGESQDHTERRHFMCVMHRGYWCIKGLSSMSFMSYWR